MDLIVFHPFLVCALRTRMEVFAVVKCWKKKRINLCAVMVAHAQCAEKERLITCIHFEFLSEFIMDGYIA